MNEGSPTIGSTLRAASGATVTRDVGRKPMNKSLVAIIVALFVTSTCLAGYEDEFPEWNMSFPQSWTWNPAYDHLIIGVATKGDLAIIVSARKTEMKTAHEMTQEFCKNTLGQIAPDLKITSFKQTTLSKLPAIVMDYDFSVDGDKMSSTEYSVIYAGCQFIISGKYPRKFFGSKKADVEEIIQTFEFTNMRQ